MKNWLSNKGKSWTLAAIMLALLLAFIFVALRTGPMAPVSVTVMTVERAAITPSLFGIGTVEARYVHKIGPTLAGRVLRVDVEPGDLVRAGQVLGEMDPVDLDDKIIAQTAAMQRAEAAVHAVESQILEANARVTYAKAQALRYSQLGKSQVVSAEAVGAKQQEFQIAQAALSTIRANLEAARQEKSRLVSELNGLQRQRSNLKLVSPVAGLVSRRDADPGTTAIAGQSVIEIVDPGIRWINVRFDQKRAQGLRAELPAQILLRSQSGKSLEGKVTRVESHADSVTEEVLAKVEFRQRPEKMPSIGELAEVTVALGQLQETPFVPNASVQRVDGHMGVWVVEDGDLRFVAVRFGASDLDGRMQALEGLTVGQQVVVYSQKTLTANRRIKIVDSLAPPAP
ncbi:MAG TPA: efflux RND transporter periplasmic adaptor subunit [Arenimonas sp.]|nr:efflux RND transporter periplasmic adaptor subunit [Arenimonas sp.]